MLSTRNVPTDPIHTPDFPPMPKRQVPSDEEDEVRDNAHQSASEEEVVKKSRESSEKTKASTANLIRMTPSNNFTSTLCLQAQPKKKQKKGKQTTGAGGEAKTNEEGDKYVDLGRNRRATVRVFKGT